MARAPKTPARTAGPLEGEALERLGDARRQKVHFDLDLREGYWFSAPHRARSVLSTTKIERQKPRDAEFLNTSFAFEMAGDFSTVVMNTFLPEGQPWATRRAGMLIPDSERKAVEDQATQGDQLIFEALNASNFYAECGKGFTPDLALGTVALWCDQPKAHRPLRWQSVPIRELEIHIGPDGCVDDRFVVRHTKFRHVKALLPGLLLGARIEERIAKDRDGDTTVVWAFWRLYEQDGKAVDEETWQHVILVDDEQVDARVLKGDGCCPLIVARWNPAVEWAWGVGPLIQALPDLRTIDDLADKKLKLIGRLLDPPMGVPDDSMTNFEEGVEDGGFYAIRPGSEDALKPIYKVEPQDASIYITQDLEARIKRLFFLDYPNQPGKTPPTATQWLDEMTMAQRRIGTPGLAFWSEFCGGVFRRTQFLLEKAGTIEPIKVNGKTVSLLPYNPAQQSYEQQTIAQFTRFAQIASGLFPEEWKVTTDGTATTDNLAKIMGVMKIWAQRKPDDIKNAISQIQSLQGGQQPTAPSVPGGPPVPQPDAGPSAPNPQFQFRGKLAS